MNYWEKECRIKFSSVTILDIFAVVGPSDRDNQHKYDRDQWLSGL